MTEAEMLDHYWNAQSAAMDTLVIYITVVSGYLIVAFLVGGRLTRSQMLFVSTTFVVFSGFALWGTIEYFAIGFDVVEVMRSSAFKSGRVAIDPGLVAGPLMLIGVIGCLKFMWDVRHSEAP